MDDNMTIPETEQTTPAGAPGVTRATIPLPALPPEPSGLAAPEQTARPRARGLGFPGLPRAGIPRPGFPGGGAGPEPAPGGGGGGGGRPPAVTAPVGVAVSDQTVADDA